MNLIQKWALFVAWNCKNYGEMYVYTYIYMYVGPTLAKSYVLNKIFWSKILNNILLYIY